MERRPGSGNFFLSRLDARIRARLSLSAEDECEVHTAEHSDKLPDAFVVFNELRRCGQLCDVVVIVDGRRLSAHRIVLSGRIPFFRAMFSTDMIEATQQEVHVHEVDYETMSLLIDYAYTAKITISTMTVQNVMIAANFLQMVDVLDEGAKFLRQRLAPSNAIATHLFCLSLGYTAIQAVSARFIQKHFVVVASTPDFVEMDLDDLLSILSQDELYIEGEEQVFEAAMRWIMHDVKRRVFAPKVLSCVRLPLLQPSFLADAVSTNDIVKSDIACRDLVDEAKDYHLLPERRCLLKSFRTRARYCHDIPGLIFVLGGIPVSGSHPRHGPSLVEVFDSITKTWSDSKPMTGMRSRLGVAVHDRKVYAIGGFDGENRLTTAECFDTVTNEWITLPSLQRKRSAMAAAFLDGKLFVCGGYDGISSLSCVEVYCSIKGVWTDEAPMSKQRSASGVAVLDGYIYILGGHDGMSIFSSAERFSIEKGEWESIQPMLSKRCRLGAAALKGKIYAAGGYDGNQYLKSVECYDPEKKQWRYVSPMLVRRCRASIASSAGSLYAVAGFDGQTNLSSCEKYCSETDSWEFVASLPRHAGGVSVGVVPIPAEMLHQHSRAGI